MIFVQAAEQACASDHDVQATEQHGRTLDHVLHIEGTARIGRGERGLSAALEDRVIGIGVEIRFVAALQGFLLEL